MASWCVSSPAWGRVHSVSLSSSANHPTSFNYSDLECSSSQENSVQRGPKLRWKCGRRLSGELWNGLHASNAVWRGLKSSDARKSLIRPCMVCCSVAGESYGGVPADSTKQFPDENVGSRDPVLVAESAPLPQRIAQFQDAFWRFLRPHTIRGTMIGTTALVARALSENSHLINWWLMPKAMRGLLALLCGNGFIVGINQIYDVGIDKVNKPFLPIAAGDLSIPAAWCLVVALATLGVGIVATHFGPLVTGLYSFGLFLGGIYSVPPLRLKQYAIPAFLIIATVRGFLLNFGVYYATRAALGLPFQWSPSIVFITIFVTVFAIVIAITKDLPDIEGDRKFNISTFATKLGVRNISFLGAGLLLANYVGAIIAGLYVPHAFRGQVMVLGHAALALALVYQTWLLDTSKYSKEGIASFYRFIWNLFYAEYTLLPFV